MKLAVVADWLTVFGGAEHAIAEFHALWPEAPLFTTVARKERLGPLSGADIRVTGLQKWYRLVGRHQLLLPWMPRAAEGIDLRGFDVVFSSSHAVAKGIIPPPTATHVCYCHTPMRYAWEMEEEYLSDFNVPRLLRPAIRRQLKKLRRWDLQTAKRVDSFIANSTETQKRIARIYARDSIVIPPPVDDRFFHVPLEKFPKHQQPRTTTYPPVPNAYVRAGNLQPTTSFLAVGRLVPYKRFDLLIRVANALKLPLTIAGRGQDEKRLRNLAGPTVTFRGFVPDAELPALYAEAKALLFPQHEDAGIVPLEAQACGTPVIAFGAGGALDSIRDGGTGIFFARQEEESLADAIRRFSALTFDPDVIRSHARQFSAASFRDRIRAAVEEAVTQSTKTPKSQ